MNLELENKVVLITGSTKGIGFSIAKAFLEEGSKVIITGRNKNSLKKAKNYLDQKFDADCFMNEMIDFTNKKSVTKLKNKILKRFKKIDIVISNVGDGKGVKKIIPNDTLWNKSWQQNFESALITTKTFIPILKSNHGSLIYISSIAGMEVIGAPLVYSVAKSSLISLAKNLSVKYSNFVRINIISPGNIIFPGGSWEKKLKNNPRYVKKLISDKVPMNTFGEPKDIANAALFLSSNKSKFTTGATLVIDGGQTKSIL